MFFSIAHTRVGKINPKIEFVLIRTCRGKTMGQRHQHLISLERTSMSLFRGQVTSVEQIARCNAWHPCAITRELHPGHQDDNGVGPASATTTHRLCVRPFDQVDAQDPEPRPGEHCFERPSTKPIDLIWDPGYNISPSQSVPGIGMRPCAPAGPLIGTERVRMPPTPIRARIKSLRSSRYCLSRLPPSPLPGGGRSIGL